MANENPLKMLASEFKLWGVDFATKIRGSNHVELVWRATPDKEERSYILASTPSDSRGWLNARADIRRLFRADGLVLKELIARKPPLEKALALPRPVDTTADQIQMLRAEVADLTDLVLDLTGALTLVRDHVIAQAPPPAKRSVRSVRVIDLISADRWTSIDDVAAAAELPRIVTYRKLQYLRQHGQAEASGGIYWRRTKQDLKIVEAK